MHRMPDDRPSSFTRRAAILAEHARRPFAPRATNPAFSISDDALARERARVRRNPVALPRPVLVVSGWRAPSIAPRMTATRLAAMTSDRLDDFVPVSIFDAGTIADAANALIDAAERAFPSDAPSFTREVDVVAISMGGLASRLAAAPRDALGAHAQGLRERRLRIARLFTLATPHCGASLADVLAPDACAKQMRKGSEFLNALDRALAADPLEIIPYARLRDGMVGAQNAAPPGMTALWVDGPPALAHLAITTDKRIMLDIALRLRGETPIACPGDKPPRH
jgi:hypothetical protein